MRVLSRGGFIMDDFQCSKEDLLKEVAQLRNKISMLEYQADQQICEWSALIHSIPTGLVITDKCGEHVYLNDEAKKLYQILSIHKTEDIGIRMEKPYLRNAGRESAAIDTTALYRALTSGETTKNQNLRCRTKDGEDLIISVSCAPIINHHGEITGAVMSHINITERIAIEDALRLSKEKYRTLFNSLDEGFCIIELLFDDKSKAIDWRHLETNRAFTGQSGVADADGKLISELVPKIEPIWLERFSNVAQTGIPERFESEAKSLNRWLDAYAFKADPLDGNQIAVLFYDITERKNKEKHIQDVLEQQRQLDVNKNAFIAMLSHELRNPLASITMGLSLEEIAGPGSEQAMHAREVIRHQSANLSRIVEDLLDVSRINSNQLELRKERLELNELVRLAVSGYLDHYQEKGIELFTDYTEPIYLDADPYRLTQAVSNLLSNTLKFTMKGDQAFVQVRCGGNEATITVSDTGPGIHPVLLPNIFEPFVQADYSLDRELGGLGLGLPIVKKILELHGGIVTLKSDGIGKGAAITLRLPLDENNKKPLGKLQLVENDSCSALQILIIEDNQDLSEILCELLESFGHEVKAYGSGPEGIAAAKQYRPDVILCDIGLPEMSGLDVAIVIRNDEELKDLYLVAMSGYAQQEDISRATDSGFDHYLTKPIELSKLKTALEHSRTVRIPND